MRVPVNQSFRLIALMLAALLLNACVESYDFEEEAFESTLVVEAMITDEIKFQKIRISRTSGLKEQGPNHEREALVSVRDDMQNEYVFGEVEPGEYVSHEKFAAQQGRNYRLEIKTTAGESYASDPASLNPGVGIERLYATRSVYKGEDGIALQIDSHGSGETSQYYRYEYEETYKIVSPFSAASDVIFEGDNFTVVPNTRNETICYSTVRSKNIILSSSNTLEENFLDGFLVRFISKTNPIISQRYSILVKQYSLSREAYTYYSMVKELSESEGLFSQHQPGFISGNLFAVERPEEKVIGFFNISSSTSERIYFNYRDYFSIPEPRPKFIEDCTITRPGENIMTPIGMIQGGSVRYWGRSSGISEEEPGQGPIRVIPTGCVDCTLYGSNETPEFWEE